MDTPKCGGPDFEAIVNFLDLKNGFNDNDDWGFCDHCFSNEGEGCETCAGDDYTSCKCKNAHRFGTALLRLDPRLNYTAQFESLPLRERAQRLLQFLRQVASNFHNENYEKWAAMSSYAGVPKEPDLTLIDPQMMYASGDVFINQFKEHNRRFYNFIHHLLFTGWADNDSYTSPGTFSPFRGSLLGDIQNYNDWNGGHRDCFHDMWMCFMSLHKSNEPKNIPPGVSYPDYSLSQLQYIPETIRRCIVNCVDDRAVSLLGKAHADSIDLYRLVRETYEAREEDLSQIQWMPCFGVNEDEFVPDVTTFGQGYNPQHERKNIDATGLLWGGEGDA